MATYPPPTENLAIFDDSVFQVNNTPLTPAEGDKRYLRFPNAQGTENMETTNVNGLLTMNAGGVVADTALTFRDATDDTGIISGVSGSLVLTALNDMTFATNSGGVYPLVLGTDNITMQSNEIVINASDQITIDGGTIDINSGAQGINILGTRIEIESVEVSIGVDTTTSIIIGNTASTLALIGSTVDLTSTGNMVLQALNGTNNAYIEFDTTFIRTLNTVEIDLTASGVIELITTSDMTLTGSTITLDAPQDEVLLATAPSGTVDMAVATVGYVNSGYIPVGDAFPSGFIGQSVRVGVNALPSGWVYCDGAEYPTNGIYANLFAVIGTTYGVPPLGKFFVPNIATQFLIASNNAGSGNVPLSNISNQNSQTGGANTISVAQMPSHNHIIECREAGSGGGSSNAVDTGNPNNTQDTNTAGGGEPFSPPYFASHFVIKL
jgi:microcystin-dependent protein